MKTKFVNLCTRIAGSDWFKANVAGACEALLMIHFCAAFPLAMVGFKWLGMFMLLVGCAWMYVARTLREKHAVEIAERKWRDRQMIMRGPG